MLKLLVLSVVLSSVFAFPAKEATANDFALNDVRSDRKEDLYVPASDIQTTITLGHQGSEGTTIPTALPPKPKQPGSMFARLIDDIFQIPISVLQSVSRLLTNPFTNSHKTPETASGY